MEGCPAHQKAIYAQEAGAMGVVFVQYDGKKPQQVRIPREFSINLAMVMVAFDSGIRMLEWLTSLYSSQTLQLRFVFSEDCTTDVYATHPDEDPFLRSPVNRIESATAGFFTLTVAKTATTTERVATLEFLKPSDGVRKSTSLPLGQQPLVFAPPRLHPCKPLPPNSELFLWKNQLKTSFVVVELTLNKCSMTQHVDFFSAMQTLGVIFVDPEFPSAVNSVAVRYTTQQYSLIPFVFISPTSVARMQASVLGNNVFIEFTGESKSL